MREFSTPEELREFLLGTATDTEDDFNNSSGNCYSLSWKKDHWIVRVNNKRLGVILRKDLPAHIDIRDNDLTFAMLSVLRTGALPGLSDYLEQLKKTDEKNNN